MEQWMLENGFGFVVSRFAGYFLMVLLGLFMVLFVHRKWSSKRLWLKGIVLALMLPLPFGVYFAFDPIYQGDIFKKSRNLSFKNETTEKLNNGLLLVGIPGCPYCLDAPKDLRLLKKRNPDLNILFGIVGSNDDGVLKPYVSQQQDIFKVENLNSTHIHKQLNIVQFPTYILVKNGTAIKAWTSSNFGALGKSEFESLLGE